jgi:cytochrome P450
MQSIHLALAGLGFILYQIISSFVATRREHAEARRRGCGAVPVVTGRDPLGLIRLISAARANRQGKSPQWLASIFDEVGPGVHTIRAKLLDYDLLVTRDPANAQAMFATQTQDFGIGAHRRETWRPLLGDGIFTAQGEAWKHSRHLLRPQFARTQISDLELEERHLQAMFSLKSLQPMYSGNKDDGWTQTVDLSPLFLCFTLDVATEFLYGHSVYSLAGNAKATSTSSKIAVKSLGTTALNTVDLQASDPERSKRATFGYHLDAGKSWICAKSFFGRWHSFITSPQFARHCREVHRLVDEFVMARLSSPAQTNKVQTKNKFSLLDELAKHTQDPIELRNETLQVLNAGRDTTGALLGWIFYFLTRHPAVFNKLRCIVLADFGTYPDPNITFQTLNSCRYLQYVINEVLRVVGVVPLNERVCLRDTVLPSGGGPDGSMPIFVHKGLRVLIAKYAMQHRADLWGEDVEDFVPERWEGKRAGWEFMPFGGGPRKCLGRQYPPASGPFVV